MDIERNNTLSTRGLFITGTDTGVGKTHAALMLMKTFAAQHFCVAGMKPVASGCAETERGLRNDDALVLQNLSSTRPPYALVNPYAFKEPIAPHIAAARAGVTIDISRIKAAYDTLTAGHDMTIVEGAGGWRVPLTAQQFFPDLVCALQIPVVLVVGLRLGCINHALLTARAIIADGATLAGWIANAACPDYNEVVETLGILTAHIPARLIGLLPHQPAPVASIHPDTLDISFVSALPER